MTANRLIDLADLTALGISNVSFCRNVAACLGLGVFGRLIGWTKSGRKVWDLDLHL